METSVLNVARLTPEWAAQKPLETSESTQRDTALRSLWRWNAACAIAHGIQAVVALALGAVPKQRGSEIARFEVKYRCGVPTQLLRLPYVTNHIRNLPAILGLAGGRASKFKLPLSTSFLDWTDGYPKQQLQNHGDLPFAAVTSGFSFLSAAAHIIILLYFDRYTEDLKRGINRFRWFEYALSSSLMIALIAMLFGVYDVMTLVGIMSVNACMNLFGLVQEELTVVRAELAVLSREPLRVDWTPFLCGCFAGVVPWAIILASILGIGPSQLGNVPGFVWALVIIYFAMFNCFAINMFLQLRGLGWWRNKSRGWNDGYIFGEKVYQILSLAAKSLLLWLVIGGTNQPNAYTQA